ncbi:hypothetical protein ACIBI4_27700 [Streptomyces sp. NPDC050418]|uniref:hypothetical protein n=1 Tax=Streptomyces sp. NPDC050418 TaxID=3365612 RepID=UPI0037B10325
MDATTRAGLILTAVTALVTLTLSVLYRFTDVPLLPRRRAPERPAVDWRSAPGLPAYSYAALYGLAVRRRDALARAVRSAREAGLLVPDGADLTFERKLAEGGPREGQYAWLAATAAQELLDECLAPDVEPTAEDLAEFEERTGGPYDRRAEEGIGLTDVVAVLEITRIGMRALACLTEGRALVLDPPCYFHPLHERGTARVPYPPDAFRDGAAGPEQVAACDACASGPPEPLLVWTEDGSVPYYRTTFETKTVLQISGYGAAAPEWDAGELLGAFVDWHVFEQEESAV